MHAPDVPLNKLAEFEAHKAELKKDPVVQEMPVQVKGCQLIKLSRWASFNICYLAQSMITSPGAHDTIAVNVSAGSTGRASPTIRVRGLAWGGGGDGINRVDVSLDGGVAFTRAELLPPPIKQRRGNVWSWQFFEQVR